MEPGARKRQRNRRKGAPPPNGLVFPSIDLAIFAALIGGFVALYRRLRSPKARS